MKKSIVLGLGILAFSSFSLAAEGGANGGGGGGICYANGKCVTLTEAGFRISKEVNTTQGDYEVSYNVVEELDKINNSLPSEFRSFSASSVIGRPGALVMLETVDPARTEQFLKEYRKVLNENASEELAKKVQILAFTIGNKTYLIQNKYEALDDRSKALLLIHENSLRTNKKSVQEALVLDGAILDYLKALENGMEPNLSGLISALSDENFKKSFLLNEFLKTSGPVYLSQEVIPNVINEYKYQPSFYFSYVTLIKMSKLNPEIKKQLVPNELMYFHARNQEGVLNSSAQIVGKALAELADQAILRGKKTFSLTNELFEGIIESYKLPEREAYNLCDSQKEMGAVLVENFSHPTSPASPTFIECVPVAKRYNALTGKQNHYRFEDALIENITGLSLNLKKEMKCKMVNTKEVLNGLSFKQVTCQ